MAILSQGTALERADFPEQLGVSSQKLQAFLDDLITNHIEIHSLMVLRHGKVAAETWRKPYEADFPHICFSVSKSIVAIAIGFAIEEGYFTLDSKVLDFFPEWQPKRSDPKLESMTVFHLLTMTAGKDPLVTDSKMAVDWLKQFFRAIWAFAPGESWKYISENQYILMEILHRATGKTATEYLTPRLYEPLGFGRVPFWETSRTGIEAGGWGIYLKTEELAKIGQCMMNKGQWQGKQVIPEKWVAKMQENLVDNTPTNEKYHDQCCGYGLCIWHNPIQNSVRMDGMFGQFVIMLYDYDALVVITSNEINEYKERGYVWRHIEGFFCEPSDTKPAHSVSLRAREISPPKSRPRNPEMEQEINGNVYKIRRPVLNNLVHMPLSVATLPILQMSGMKHGNINNVSLTFSDDGCIFKWTEDSEEGFQESTVLCGMDGMARQSPVTIAGVPYTMNCWGAWESDNSITLHLRPLQSLNDRKLNFSFKGDRVRIMPEMSRGFVYLMQNMCDIFLEPFMPMPKVSLPVIKLLSPVLGMVAEPELKGRKLTD